MVRRRTLLRRGLATVGAVGVGTLAGCQESELDDGGDGNESDGDGDGGTTAAPQGPAWASWLYDPTALGDVDAHAFSTYDVGTLLEYRGQLPSELDQGIQDLFGELEGVTAESIDRVTGQGYNTLPEDTSTSGSQPFGWTVVATGSVEPEAVVTRLGDTEAYTDAGEYEGFRLFEGPPDDQGRSAAVAIGSEAVLGGGTFDYDVSATAPVERAIDANAGSVDRYYGTHEYVAALMDRHGDATTATGAADPDGSFQPFVEENPSSQAYESLLTTARAVGRSATLGEETTEASLSVELAEVNQEAVEDLQTAVDRAQAERRDPEGPFSEPSVSADGTTLVVEASADTEAALSTPSGLGVVAPELAVVGTFALNVGGPDREPAPQIALSYELRDDGRVRVAHDGGDAVERLLLQYSVQDSGRTQEEWTESDGVTAGDTYVTQDVPEPGTELLVLWESGDQSAVIGAYDVPE